MRDRLKNRRLLSCSKAAGALAGAIASVSMGQVKFDGSLGQAGELTGPSISIPAARGQQRGGNLFHSFSEFNVNAGQSVRFAGPSSVQNILARVTGGQISTINGQLGSDIAGANLYLINKAGVVFSEGAQLDVSGSLVVTTADVLRMQDGGRFNADLAAGDDLLTTAPVQAFGFLSPAPNGVGAFGNLQTSPIVRAVVQVPPERTISVISGPQGYSFANLVAPSGRINLVAVGGRGEVTGTGTEGPVQPGSQLPRADITIANASNIDASGLFTGGDSPSQLAGDVQIQARTLNLGFLASVNSSTRGPGQDGDLLGEIDIRLSEQLLMDLGSSVLSENTSPEADSVGATVRVDARVVTLVNNNNPDIFGDTFTSITTASSLGAAGPLAVNARLIEIGGPLPANITSGGTGRTANIFVTATDALRMTGKDSAINATSTGDTTGNVQIFAGRVFLSDGARIFARAQSGLGGGRVIVSTPTEGAGLVRLTGTSTIFGAAGDRADAPGGSSIFTRELELRDLSGISTSASSLTGQDNGGPVEIHAYRVRMLNSTEIASSTTANPGRGGMIRIEAGHLLIDGTDRQPNPVSGALIPATITASSIEGEAGGPISLDIRDSLVMRGGARIAAFTSDGQGPGGTIDVAARTIDISGVETLISSASLGGGDAGAVSLRADSITIAGSRSGVRSPTVEADPPALFGRGGDINVRAGTLSLSAGGQLQTSSASRGGGGMIDVEVRSAEFDGTDAPEGINTGLVAEAQGVGAGGEVRLRVGDALVIRDGGRITTQSIGVSTRSGDAGNVVISAGMVRLLDGGVVATQSAASNAGDITIDAGRSLTLLDSRPGAVGPTSDTAFGDTFAGPRISARASGNGGNINIIASELVLLRRGLITAQTGEIGGQISIDPDVVVIDKSIIDGRSAGTPVPVSIVTDGLLLSNDSFILTDVPLFDVNNDIAGSLTALDAQIADATQKLIDSCARQFAGGDLDAPARGQSSFIVEGKGGIPWRPGTALPAIRLP